MVDDRSAFIQVVEVWVPEGNLLRHHSGSYGRHTDLARVSASTTFRRGQGLPGTAWSKGAPVVWPTLRHQFVRQAVVRDSGLRAGIAIPIFQMELMVAVLVLLFGDPDEACGAIEVWEPKVDRLAHSGAYYGSLEPAFGNISRRLTFPRGQGLPGMTWLHGRPTLIDDLRSWDYFVRAVLAREYGVQSGIGIPFYRGGHVTQVVTLLSRERTPIARAFEVWSPDVNGNLRLQQSAYSADLATFAAESRGHTFAPGEGLPGRAYQSGLPVVLGNIQVGPFVRHRAAEQAGLNVGVAIPIHDGKETIAVVVLLM